MGYSFDHKGPILQLGAMDFSAESNIPGLKKIQFKADAFLCYSEESTLFVEWNGVTLWEKDGWNDYYGFGTSSDNLLGDMNATLDRLKGGPNCKIVSKISASLCVISTDAPFYAGAQRVQELPRSWRKPASLTIPQPESFTVWENGKATSGAADFLEAVKAIANQDAAPNRNGELRSVFSRQTPLSEIGFMWNLAHPKAPT